jgi:hypothetical protein
VEVLAPEVDVVVEGACIVAYGFPVHLFFQHIFLFPSNLKLCALFRRMRSNLCGVWQFFPSSLVCYVNAWYQSVWFLFILGLFHRELVPNVIRTRQSPLPFLSLKLDRCIVLPLFFWFDFL